SAARALVLLLVVGVGVQHLGAHLQHWPARQREGDLDGPTRLEGRGTHQADAVLAHALREPEGTPRLRADRGAHLDGHARRRAQVHQRISAGKVSPDSLMKSSQASRKGPGPGCQRMTEW